jgi:hypothetical protein
MTIGTADGFYFIITIPQAVLPLGGFVDYVHFLTAFLKFKKKSNGKFDSSCILILEHEKHRTKKASHLAY